MKKHKLKVAAVGDIHLGHPNTTTREIIANLRKAFPDSAETGTLDLILLEGDVFDRLLTLPDGNSFEIKGWINNFLRMCKRRNIVVRVLEGTPSHDWNQSRLFISCNEDGEIGADVKHVTDLSIEYLEQFDSTILYVPDEWEAEPDETWRQVNVLLKENFITKVDFALMHGSFEYQLPAHVKLPSHTAERYLSIVKHYIFIGHIHRHTRMDRILAAGSFDRLAHGEEEPKGHLRVTINDGLGDEIVFVENTGAKVYKSYDCTGLPIEAALSKLDAVELLPDNSYIRIIAAAEDPILTGLDTLRMKFPLMCWSSKVSTRSVSGKEMLVDMRSKYTGLRIDEKNLPALLEARLRNKVEDPTLLAACLELLKGVL